MMVRRQISHTRSRFRPPPRLPRMPAAAHHGYPWGAALLASFAPLNKKIIIGAAIGRALEKNRHQFIFFEKQTLRSEWRVRDTKTLLSSTTNKMRCQSGWEMGNTIEYGRRPPWTLDGRGGARGSALLATSKGRSSTAKAAKQKERTTTILGSHAELGPGPRSMTPLDDLGWGIERHRQAEMHTETKNIRRREGGLTNRKKIPVVSMNCAVRAIGKQSSAFIFLVLTFHLSPDNCLAN